MDDEQLLRYSRHILLDELGIEGQRRLLSSHALVIGAGGLGSPVLLYLASAGVGTIRLVDADVVDATNLQRQIAHDLSSVGLLKVRSAADRIRSINPDVRVIPEATRATGDLLNLWVAEADVIIDCTDNFLTRFLVNDACVTHRKPLVSGAAVRFEGQLVVFDLRQADSACFGCLFLTSDHVEEARCSTMGVFAPLVGIIGAAQAAEALKLLSGCEPPPTADMLRLFDAGSMSWTNVRVHRSPACSACGTGSRMHAGKRTGAGTRAFSPKSGWGIAEGADE